MMTHRFLQDSKWWEDVLHVLMGILPLGLVWWWREWDHQWPPGDVIEVLRPGVQGTNGDHAPLDRVSDVGRDSLGYVIGATLRNVGLLIWLFIWWSGR